MTPARSPASAGPGARVAVIATTSAPTSERIFRRGLAAGAVLPALYVGLSFANDPRGFLGTDTGGKVATLRAMEDNARLMEEYL